MINNQNNSQKTICPVCNAANITVLVEVLQSPIHCNLLWSTRQQAIQAPRGDIRLGFCQDCGHIFNLAFNPKLMEYAPAYENSLHFSPRFQSYTESLAAGLIDRYDLHSKDIIDIGCGQGDFLKLLCQLGANRGLGFDPSYTSDQNAGTSPEHITFIQDFYSERYANYQADLICCRHVLEHIQYPRDFLNSIRHSIGNCLDTALFFEVPNVLFTLRDLGIWDLIYEHCSYFSANSLSHLFTSLGFDVRNLTETYKGQFLCVEALPRTGLANSSADHQNNLNRVTDFAPAFVGKYQSTVESWRRSLKQMTQARQRVVVWGSGSKGVTFLNTLQIQEQIAYVVDINPRKHGMYTAGTGQQIVPPEFLRNYQPDVIIIMNSIYQQEIQQIVEKLDLAPKFMCAS